MSDSVTLHEPFTQAEQQHQADLLGMYVFLASEIMLFGGVFAVLMACRILHPQDFVEASRKLHLWIGTANTVLLLTSSLAVALAVDLARRAVTRGAVVALVVSAILGAGFLGLKAMEYGAEYADGVLPVPGSGTAFSGPGEHLFMNLYLVATGLHAVHLTVGIVLLLGLAVRLWTGSVPLPRRAVVVELCGLYWHLVDIVWIFLFPALYLAR